MENFKEAKVAYQNMKRGRIAEARYGFRRLLRSGGKSAMTGYIGLAAAETASAGCDEEKIAGYLSQAAEYSSYAAGLTRAERGYLKHLVNNSCFPEYRLPLIYFALRNNLKDAADLLILLGAEKDSF